MPTDTGEHYSAAGVRKISPTDIAQYIRLEQCQRYLRLRLHERARGRRFMAGYGVAPQAIPPLLTRSGARFEDRVEQSIAAHHAALNLATPAVSGHPAGGVRAHDNERVARLARLLPPGATLVLFQARLHVEVAGWLMRGDVDILRLARDADGALRVLIADIKSSTELMEDLDPEDARAIVDPALKVMIDAVCRYDGYIVQSTGDGIFALFGAPLAHEDHPQRALYAALRMQEEIRHYAARLQEEGRAPIEIRVGINSGEVVVRSLRTGKAQTEYTPIGHTTNLASRLQAIARTGSIVVSENTRRLAEGYFQLRALGGTRVKGISEPVKVYEVTGLGPLRTRLQRAVGRGLNKFVGRVREVDTMRDVLELAKAGHGQIVAVMGEPGVGKSRLFFEFKAIGQSGCLLLEAYSIYGKASAYLPLIELLRDYFRLTAEDNQRQRREKINRQSADT